MCIRDRDPTLRDVYSFDMVVRLGVYYLDLYLSNPRISELSVSNLDRSIYHLAYAVNRYGRHPLSEVLLPYGELALAFYYKGRSTNEVARTYQDRQSRVSNQGLISSRKRDPFANADRSRSTVFSTANSYARGERYLKDYLRKSKTERDLVNTIQALLALGDLNILTDRANSAKRYYDLAWTGAQNLPVDHPLVESFNNPVKLPAFTVSVVRRPQEPIKETELVSLSINVDDDGKVRKVQREALVEASVSSTTRARRVVRRARFRPVIENGKLVPVKDYAYDVELTVRNSKPKPVAVEDSAE